MKTLPRFRTQYSAHQSPKLPKSLKKSLTVPTYDLPIVEILRRSANGLAIPETRQTYYDEDRTIPDLSRMEFADVHDYILNLQTVAAENEYKLRVAKNYEQKRKIDEAEEVKTKIRKDLLQEFKDRQANIDA